MSAETDMNDAIDRALSADALHKAAKEGEPAASVLLIYGKANPAGVSGLAALFKRAFVGGSFEDSAAVRAIAAHALSDAFLDSPVRKMRQAARAYLKGIGSRAKATPEQRLKILLNAAEQLARDMLLRNPEHALWPTWLLLSDKDQIAVLATPFGSVEEKDIVVANMRRMMAEAGAVAYCHVAEAWMGKAESTMRPSEDPDRVEIVSALAYTANESESAIWTVKRDADGKPVELELLDRKGPTGREGSTGRFSWLLSPMPPETLQ